MSNLTSYQITGDTAHAHTSLAIAAPKSNAPSQPTALAAGNKVQVDHRGDGSVAVSQGGATTTYIAQPRPGMVHIPGLGETTVAAAKAAGLLPEGFQEPGAGNAAAPGTVGAPQQAPQNAPKASQDDTPADAPAHEKLLGGLAEKIGTDNMRYGVYSAADIGDASDAIAKGVVTEAHVETLVQGFTEQANEALRAMPGSAAVSVDMLSEVLSDEELRHCRTATIMGDTGKLQHYGRQALNRFETLPYKDPTAFSALIADMPAAEREALRYDETSREWTVNIPGRAPMSFAKAVRSGIVWVGRER